MELQNNLELSYDINGDDVASAGGASTEVKQMLKKLGINADIVRRISIAMYEAEINTAIHGGGGRAEVRISPDRFTAEFTDHGPGIADVELAMKEGYSTAPQHVREMGFGAGMGLANIKRYADKLEIESTVGIGTVVRIEVEM